MKEELPKGTHRASTDFSLLEVEQHFAELISGVEDHAIFLLDPNGIVKSWNSGARRIKGYQAEEIIGRSFTTFYSQESIEAGWPQTELEEATAHGRFQDEGWRKRKDGSLMWANVVITALRNSDGTLRGFLKITRDLTERKQAEETLRQSEERLRLMIESVQDYAIFMLDPDGRVASWNLGAERIKGYTAPEIIGKHFSVFYPTEEVSRNKPQELLEVAIRDGRVEAEGWRVHKDRSQFWANVVITALRGRDGELRGFAKITRDLTDKRQVEQLQVADRQKNEFLAMLAHELRNPLAPIRTGVQLFKIMGSSDPVLDQTAEMMERQVQHLVRLVDDLLDVSRIITGKIQLDKAPVDLREVLTRAVEAVQPAVDERGHELMISQPARAIMVDADLVRLTQVASNLLLNAVKYTEQPSQIWVTVEPYENDVAVRVQDPGVGMTPEQLSRVFTLFEQVDVSLARAGGGLGIGLTLVQRIVEMHGGSVTASSPGLGQGSEFVFRIPLATSAPALHELPAHIESVRIPVSGHPILVVDDNVDAALGVERLLKLWGHEVQTAFGGPDALEKIRSFQPRMIILDIGMPGMSGYEVAKRVRADAQFDDMVLVALTGYSQPEDRRRSREAGIDHHLVKPPAPADLQRLIDALKPA